MQRVAILKKSEVQLIPEEKRGAGHQRPAIDTYGASYFFKKKF